MISFLVAALLCDPAAIVHVRLLVGDGTSVEDAAVVWDKGRITYVGRSPSDGTGLPEQVTPIDGRGKVLTPGFIEVASRLGLREVEQEETTNDYALAEGPITPGFHAGEGFNPASVHIAITRREGITSAVILPAGQIIYGTAGFIDLTGSTQSRRDAKVPIALMGAVGNSAARHVGARGGVWLELREAFDEARFYQKNRAAIDRGDSRALHLRPVHLRALQPVLAKTMPLLVHAERASDILTAIELAQQEGIKLIIYGGAEAWQVTSELARAGIFVILRRPSTQQPSSFEELGARSDAARLLQQSHVPLVISAGPSSMDLGRLRQEAGVAVALGLPYDAAVRAITLAPARAFGKDKELGSVQVGKRANLVMWSGDPLELSEVAEKIWIDGVLQAGESRQDKLVRRYLNASAGG